MHIDNRYVTVLIFGRISARAQIALGAAPVDELDYFTVGGFKGEPSRIESIDAFLSLVVGKSTPTTWKTRRPVVGLSPCHRDGHCGPHKSQALNADLLHQKNLTRLRFDSRLPVRIDVLLALRLSSHQ